MTSGVNEFTREQLEVYRSADLGRFIQYCVKYEVPLETFEDDRVLVAALH